MKHTPKIVEDAVEEFKKKCELTTKEDGFLHYEEDYEPLDFEVDIIENWLTKTLTHIHTQAKEEVIKDFRKKVSPEDYEWDGGVEAFSNTNK